MTFQCHIESHIVTLIVSHHVDSQLGNDLTSITQDLRLQKSVFYQDLDGTIRERRHAGNSQDHRLSWKWHPTSFAATNALVGTSLAVVQDADGMKAILFHQDHEGFICCR